MRNILRYFIVIVLFLISVKVSAQEPIQIYPKVNLGDGKNKPFDKEYDLMIPFTKEGTVYYVYLYKHRGNKSFSRSLDKEKLGHIKASQPEWEWDKLNDTTYLKVKMRYDENNDSIYTLLKPSRSYSLIIFNGLTPGSKKIIDALGSEYKKTGSILNDTSGTAFKEYLKQYDRQKKKNKITTYKTSFKEYIDFYIDKLRPLEDSLTKSIKTDTAFKVSCERGPLFDDSCIGSLLKLFNGEGCLKVPVKCIDTCNVLNLILSLKKLTCENLLDYANGRITLAGLGLIKQSEYPAMTKYSIRKSNIGLNISDLLKLKNALQQILLQLTGSDCKEDIQCLKSIEKTLADIVKTVNHAGENIGKILKFQEDIESEKLTSRLFIDYDVTGMNTYIYNFQARNEMAITPVFGYAYYGFQKGFGGFTPYLGFQVNFQGLNRDDPFNQIHRKTVLQRLCFTTAWTLTGMEESNKRYDLFDKSSLITCLGFKLGHVAMINAGGLWFKREDPNPLITSKKVAITPVIALSLNLEVDKLLNGFSKLIPKK